MSIARRILAAAVHKLLPETVPDYPGTSLTLRQHEAPLMLRAGETPPHVSHAQIIYPQPSGLMQSVVAAPPRRRKVTVIEETIYVERRG